MAKRNENENICLFLLEEIYGKKAEEMENGPATCAKSACEDRTNRKGKPTNKSGCLESSKKLNSHFSEQKTPEEMDPQYQNCLSALHEVLLEEKTLSEKKETLERAKLELTLKMRQQLEQKEKQVKLLKVEVQQMKGQCQLLVEVLSQGQAPLI
jgi:hypothetical protein